MSDIIAKLKRSLPSQLLLFYLFLASGLIVNFLQFCSCIIWPFNKPLYRRINTFLAYLFWSELTWVGQHWSGTEVDVYFEPGLMKYVNKEHVINVMNHKYDIDWLMGWIICQRTGLLPV